MTDPRPLLYAEKVADGALALYRAHRNGMTHVSTIFSRACVTEALRDGWSAATANGEAMHRVVLVADVYGVQRAAFAQSAG